MEANYYTTGTIGLVYLTWEPSKDPLLSNYTFTQCWGIVYKMTRQATILLQSL